MTIGSSENGVSPYFPQNRRRGATRGRARVMRKPGVRGGLKAAAR
jgi:hypothetical protein